MKYFVLSILGGNGLNDVTYRSTILGYLKPVCAMQCNAPADSASIRERGKGEPPVLMLYQAVSPSSEVTAEASPTSKEAFKRAERRDEHGSPRLEDNARIGTLEDFFYSSEAATATLTLGPAPWWSNNTGGSPFPLPRNRLEVPEMPSGLSRHHHCPTNKTWTSPARLP